MIVVVGAGPAGIAAALRVHECGAPVTVIDDNPAPGGQIWRGDFRQKWIRRFHASGIPVWNNSRAISGDAITRTLLVETPDGPREVGYERLILATGAREIFLPFPGWTLPGVTGAGGLQAMAKSGLPLAAKRIVVGGSGPLLIAAAAYFRRCGAHVKLIAEQAPLRSLAAFARELLRSPSKLTQGVVLAGRIAGTSCLPGCWIEAAEGVARLERVVLRQGAKTWTEDCDYAAIGYGLTPNDELAALLNVPVCGGAAGVELSIVEGEIAGYEAAGRPEKARALHPRRDAARRFARALDSAFRLRPELKTLPQPGTIVCRCEDVTLEKLRSHASFRSAKLHTRCGMGPCQGRICGPAAKFLFGWSDTGSVRPPVLPARISTLLPDTDNKTI